MLFNFRYPIILYVLSFFGVMVGLLFKILHRPGASLTIGSMLMVQAFAIVWLIVILECEGKLNTIQCKTSEVLKTSEVFAFGFCDP